MTDALFWKLVKDMKCYHTMHTIYCTLQYYIRNRTSPVVYNTQHINMITVLNTTCLVTGNVLLMYGLWWHEIIYCNHGYPVTLSVVIVTFTLLKHHLAINPGTCTNIYTSTMIYIACTCLYYVSIMSKGK